MTSRDFCFWLQGYFEIYAANGTREDLTDAQVECVRRHLALVFKHEIDPAIEATSPATKAELDKTHTPMIGGVGPGGEVYRC